MDGGPKKKTAVTKLHGRTKGTRKTTQKNTVLTATR
jgi:hypothetical protein